MAVALVLCVRRVKDVVQTALLEERDEVMQAELMERMPTVPLIQRQHLTIERCISSSWAGGIHRGQQVMGEDGGPKLAVTVWLCNGGGDDNAMQDTFLKEVENLAKLQHASVMTLYGVCVDPGTSQTMAVCEPLFNGTLLQRLHHNSAGISVFELLRHAISIASALQYIANEGIVYRVVTCERILLSQDNTAKLEFPFQHAQCKEQGQNGQEYTDFVRWMAPESLEHDRWDSRSMAWSYGVFLMELFSQGRRNKCHRDT